MRIETGLAIALIVLAVAEGAATLRWTAAEIASLRLKPEPAVNVKPAYCDVPRFQSTAACRAGRWA